MTHTLPARGYTLVELIVSVGLFSLVMTLAAGAYFITINVNRHAQGVSTGIDSISFVVERMARSIRTGSNYSSDFDSTFSFTDSSEQTVVYRLSGETIEEVIDGQVRSLTDPSSVSITHMRFYLSGSAPSDNEQPRVTIVIGGNTSTGAGKTETFLVETGATMRGIDL